MLLWWKPPLESFALLAAYYGFAYFVFDTLATLASVPYYALTPELTPDYDERTSLTMYRNAFSIAAGILGFAAPELVNLSIFPNVMTGYLFMAAIFGFISTVPLWGVFAVAPEKPEHAFRPQLGTSSEGGLFHEVLSWMRGRWRDAAASAA
jgi:GPH family glycoside/pentoside/hexuronide:cation symporter